MCRPPSNAWSHRKPSKTDATQKREEVISMSLSHHGDAQTLLRRDELVVVVRSHVELDPVDHFHDGLL